MERNIAALLREDAYTIRVTFNTARRDQTYLKAHPDESVKSYNYVTTIPGLKIGDFVVVEAAGQYKVAIVEFVDNSVEIPPQYEHELRWVIAKVDFSPFEALMAENAKIESLVQEAYKANLRRSFKQQILSGVDARDAEALQLLLGHVNKGNEA